jgi:hypothetical protein
MEFLFFTNIYHQLKFLPSHPMQILLSWLSRQASFTNPSE